MPPSAVAASNADHGGGGQPHRKPVDIAAGPTSSPASFSSNPAVGCVDAHPPTPAVNAPAQPPFIASAFLFVPCLLLRLCLCLRLPLPRLPGRRCQPLPRWVVVVCGRRGSGKDFLAAALAAEAADREGPTARALAAAVQASGGTTAMDGGVSVCIRSISEATKRAYAAQTGADAELLLGEGPEARAYKEAHRAALLAFHEGQARAGSWDEGMGVRAHGPGLLRAHFVDTVRAAGAAGCALTVVTGLREPEVLDLPRACRELLPGIQVVTVLVLASDAAKARRHGWAPAATLDAHPSEAALEAAPRALWGAVFENEAEGMDAARAWVRGVLLPVLLRGPPGAGGGGGTDGSGPEERGPEERGRGPARVEAGGAGPQLAARERPTAGGERLSTTIVAERLRGSSGAVPVGPQGPGAGGGTQAGEGPPEDPRVTRFRQLVPCTPDFPRPGIVFRNILHLSAEGLALSAELLAERLLAAAAAATDASSTLTTTSPTAPLPATSITTAAAADGPCADACDARVSLGAAAGIDAVAGVEAGGLVFAAPVAALLRVPLIPLRKRRGGGNVAAPLPPPLLSSAPYGGSFIGAHASAVRNAVANPNPDTSMSSRTADGGSASGLMPASQPPAVSVGEEVQQQQCLEVWAPALAPLVPGCPLRVCLVDDVLSSGATAGAAVGLLRRGGAEVVAVGVAGELPEHGGRATLAGMGVARVEALLAFPGL
ncbi:hypothetical protein HYH03_001249 [Edaphochlamys debaryana]|uniref:adenine phosphoribosyltransferase n=1 Tax=Edaphochlamys debaryana TaxID=47281 RepID=A0A835YN11_9CHLO|nr:hypothetical protein HYH03_001249 [Edaphochlamys debaryana]|eukprot:KAG2501470.1 hypothetical protein HYH03_001249 [Edaphochlamys debaryana]